MRIDDLFAPCWTFVARVIATVTTDDCRPGRRHNFLPAADTALSSLLPHRMGAARAWQMLPLPRRVLPSTILLRRAPHRKPTPTRSLIRPRPLFHHMTIRHLRLPCRLRAGPPLGRALKQTPLQAPSHLLLTMGSGPAGPLAEPFEVLTSHRESHGRERL